LVWRTIGQTQDRSQGKKEFTTGKKEFTSKVA
jgi:hypothetical protein